MTSRPKRFVSTVAFGLMGALWLAACGEATPVSQSTITASSTPASAVASDKPTSDKMAAIVAVAAVDATPAVITTTISPPADITTPVPAAAVPAQRITINLPASGAMLDNPFQLNGDVALTPQDQRLAYVLRDVGGAVLASGMLDVAGEPGQAGVFSMTVRYRPSLPGIARLEVIAIDETSVVEAQIPSLVVNPQKGISLNLNGVASSATGQMAARVPNAPRAWVDLNGVPRHLRVLFDGEAAAEIFTPRQRQLRVLPLDGYRALFKGTDLERFDETIQNLRRVLAAQPAALERELLVLPASDQSQAFHAQMRTLNFNGGSGVRFITYLTQELEPFNGSKLVYVFQGLTTDGRHLVSAFMPVSSTVLAATPQDVSAEERDRFKRSYADYVAHTVGALDQSPDSFTPSLAGLDGMITSLTIGSDLFEDAPSATPVPAPAGGALLTGKTIEPLNMRTGPGTGYRRLKQLAAGEQLELLRRSADGKWLEARPPGGATGWVSRQYVQPSGDPTTLPVAP